MAGNTSVPGATVVSRSLALLFAFDETHRRLALSELARRACLPLPTAHRLVGASRSPRRASGGRWPDRRAAQASIASASSAASSLPRRRA
ncbi:helix-turn-helix domain-containing protein [Nocardioides humi]|uniref:HTH iclR-type domain-containing protein n=1 Tax=Nocardioides humi TaxID=449461 RepID=A0ABN2AST4_9ACTN